MSANYILSERFPSASRISAVVDWGDAPTWLTGLATVALFVAALAAALYARNTWRHQVQETIQQQAERVSGWVEREYLPGGARDFSVIVSNDSAQPVYEMVCTVHGIGPEVEVPAPNLRDATRSIIPPGSRAIVARLPIEQAQRATRIAGTHLGEVDDRGVLPSDLLVEVIFRDSRGARWARRTDGSLERLKPRRPATERD